MEKVRIGYFSTLKVEDQFIGGVMVTDSLAIPLEFKYTDAIRPTKIHQIIFGKVLVRYIHEEVIKKNLLKEVRSAPAVYLVGELELLGDEAPGRVPLVAVQKTPLPALEAVGAFQRVKDKEVLAQPGTSTSPLRLTFHTPELDVQEKVLSCIRSVIDTMDLLEPFDRVETALKALCQNRA
jgi:hypothetical protein